MVLAQDLRDAVLQAAFNGLLTEREKTDSSVFDLIRQIGEEKRVNKSKYYTVSEESEKNIPNSWTVTKIGNIIIKDLGGGTPSKNNPKYWNGNIPWMSVKDFSNCKNNILNDTIDHITQEGVDNSSTNIIDTNAIILCTRMGLGKFCKITQPIAINQDLRAIWLSKKINESYFIYFYSSLTINGTGTTVKGIKKDELFNHLIPIPPIEEQQRIVDRVNEFMEKIDEYEKVEKELIALEQKFPDDMKNALLQAAMQGKLTEQLDSDSSVDEMLEAIKEEKKQLIKDKKIKKDKRLFSTNEIVALFDIPSSWKWTTIGNLVYKLTDGTHKTPKYTENGVKFVSVKDMSTGRLSLANTKYISQEEHEELYERCNPEKGDILLSKVGTTGVPAIVDTDEQFSLFVSLALLKFNHKYINQKFFYYLIYSPLIQQQATENTKGIGNKNWVLDKIANTLVVVPPIEEQQRIVEKLEQLLPFCETL